MSNIFYPDFNSIAKYDTFSVFPASANHGDYAVALDTNILYEFNGTIWIVVASPSGSSVDSVTGWNVDNTDPANPVITNLVTDATLTGIGTSGSPLSVTGGITGTGAANLVAYWSGTHTLTGETGFEYNASSNEFKVTGSTADSSSFALSAFSSSNTHSFRFRNDGALMRDGNVYSQPLIGAAVVTWGIGAGAANTGGTSSTYIGNNAGVNNNGRENTVVGAGSASGATNSMIQSTVIGYTSGINITSGLRNTAIGWYCARNIYGGAGLTTGTGNTIVGGNAAGSWLDAGVNNAFFGELSGFFISGNNNTHLGTGTAGPGPGANAFNHTIAIGYNAIVTASNQLVIGSALSPVNDAYVGSGITNIAPVALTLQTSGGSGTNITGADFSIASGKGTGSAPTSVLSLKSPTPGSSGTTLQSLNNWYQQQYGLVQLGDVDGVLSNTMISMDSINLSAFVNSGPCEFRADGTSNFCYIGSNPSNSSTNKIYWYVDFSSKLLQGIIKNTLVFEMDEFGDVHTPLLHNNAAPIGNATDGQEIRSGTYTPTILDTKNLDSSPDPQKCQWMRVGNVVTVSGKMKNVDVSTTAVLTWFSITLPVASALTDETDCAGTAGMASDSTGENGIVFSDTTFIGAKISWFAIDTNSNNWFFTFTYEVL